MLAPGFQLLGMVVFNVLFESVVGHALLANRAANFALWRFELRHLGKFRVHGALVDEQLAQRPQRRRFLLHVFIHGFLLIVFILRRWWWAALCAC